MAASHDRATTFCMATLSCAISDGRETCRHRVRTEAGELPYGMICSHQALLRAQHAELLRGRPNRSPKWERIRSDYEFLLRCRAQGRTFHRIPILVAEIEAGGLSDRRRMAALRETAVLLYRGGLFGPRAILRLAFMFVWTAAAMFVKPLLPPPVLDAARRCKVAVFGTRSALS